jgi:toxin FitB
MIILDTNVLSALMNAAPDPRVVAWLDAQPRSSIWTTSITILEIRFGLQIMSVGRKRSTLLQAFESTLTKIDHRVVDFDESAAQQAGDLMAARQQKGWPGDLRDTMVAGIAITRHATLATRNGSHFSDIPAIVVNPWAA